MLSELCPVSPSKCSSEMSTTGNAVGSRPAGSASVAVVPGSAFGPSGAGHVRMCYATSYEGLELGRQVKIGPGTWTVVGLMDAGGSAFDSEVWAAPVLGVDDVHAGGGHGEVVDVGFASRDPPVV